MNHKKRLKDNLNIVSGKIEASQAKAELDPKINEVLEKYNRLDAEFDNLRRDFVTILGIFASFFIFISTEFQILKSVTDFWLLLGFSSFLLSGLLLFALVLTNIARDKLDWKNFFNPVFLLLFVLFAITITFFFIYAYDP